MLEQLWQWLSDPANREVLSWLGGGLVGVVGGGWTVFKFFWPRSEQKPSPPAVSIGASRIGRDVTLYDLSPRMLELVQAVMAGQIQAFEKGKADTGTSDPALAPRMEALGRELGATEAAVRGMLHVRGEQDVPREQWGPKLFEIA